ncbi:Protein of unknown function [Cotesia congregata]|uniref:Uncharacterized protein n=1 Tax=Cotesia congregata TaxID=51543 RepID=A0A8J2MHI5_COTCN|nr:Protein of unknown function [Cotesia congregata]
MEMEVGGLAALKIPILEVTVEIGRFFFSEDLTVEKGGVRFWKMYSAGISLEEKKLDVMIASHFFKNGLQDSGGISS